MVMRIAGWTRRARATGRAVVLASLAGRAAGMMGARRRGSILILIVGALAMLSIVTLVYFSVGRADRRTATVAVHRDRVGEVIGKFQEYVATDIIAADVLATTVDGLDEQLIDPPANQDGVILRREASDYPSTDRSLRSVPRQNRPWERFDPIGTYAIAWDPGSASTSLSTRDPRVPSDPWLADAEPTWLGAALPASPLPSYMAPDWRHITNIAPSGNFVSLFNLRGNFEAESGFDPANPLQPLTNGMSDNLMLAPPITALSGNLAQTYTPPGLDYDPGRQPEPATPAHWDTRQRYAARPAGSPVPYRADNPRYPAYQWADADGDGVLDSRWFEMVDVSDPDAPLPLLPVDNQFRYVFAARIIDLSSRVNVNTAAEFADAPSAGVPVGSSPAEVDLLRLLRLSDVYGRYVNSAGVGSLVGYDRLQPAYPDDANVPENYSIFGSTPYDGDAARDIGLLSYLSLSKTMQELVIPDPFVQFPAFAPLTAEERLELYRQRGANASGAGYTGTGTAKLFLQGGVFNGEDMLELLTFNGVNNPEVLSRLEQAAGGGRSGNTATPDPNLSPLRENRTDHVERASGDNLENTGQGNGVLDDDAWVRLAADVRSRLTVFSGARPLTSSIIMPGFENRLDPSREMRVDAVEAFQAATHPTLSVRDASLLFATYADALLPHSWRIDGAGLSAWAAPAYATLAYGHDPILAAWAAGHMTVNAIDMWDKDEAASAGTGAADTHTPTAVTMALGGDPTSLGAIDSASGIPNALYPFWTPRPGGATGNTRNMPGVLDLDYALGLRSTNNDPNPNQLPPSRMARQGDLPPGMPEAVNIFGVEAQPFIVEAATIVIYTDAPVSAGADDEWEPAPPGQPPRPTPPNIDGNVSETNPDFLCQVLAFQITNPFDVDIGLTNGDPADTTIPAGYTNYYIEFGGHFYRMVDTSTGTATAVKLERRDATPGAAHDNTRVFYVMNDSFDNIVTRFADAGHSTLGGTMSATEIRAMIERQIGLPGPLAGDPPVAPILLQRMDPNTGGPLSGFVDLMDASREENVSVKLWRSMPETITGAPPSRVNDLMADRLNDPVNKTNTSWRPTLDRRMSSGQKNISGKRVGQDPTPPANGPPLLAEDNTGMTIAFWASFKRMDDSGITAPSTMLKIPRGALPAYCIEAKEGWTSASNPLRNIADPGPQAQVISLSGGDFDGDDRDSGVFGADYLFNPGATLPKTSFWHQFGDVMSAPVLDPISKRSHTAVKGSIREWPEEKTLAGEVIPSTPGTNGQAYHEMYPEVPLENERFEKQVNGQTVSVLRVADMLLPLGIGPMAVPIVGPGAPPGPICDQEEAWLTLGEAMALSLGYASPHPTQTRAAWQVLAGLGGYDNGGNPTGPGGQPRPKMDRGNLVLDDFAPFEDSNADGVFDPGGSNPDFRREPGIPLALSILDRFRTLEPQFGSIGRATPGVINLNTAPVPVLSCLPLLAPARTWEMAPIPGTSQDWISQSVNGMDDLSPPGTRASDVASTLAAYRDKAQGLSRSAAYNQTSLVDISFADFPGGTDPSPGHGMPNALDVPATWNGRYGTTVVEGIREAPGLNSIGEAMALFDLSGSNRIPSEDRIDYLGAQLQTGATPANGGKGTSSILYRDSASTTPNEPTAPNEIVNDFSEKLLVGGALSNTASVRSDVFAVWFVVHGYQKSDTENLGPNDPLVPTLQRRYVMVVDRSNVTRRGDKPRILFSAELPD